MIGLVLIFLVAQTAPAAEVSPRATISIRTVGGPGLKIHYLYAPWGPNTFAAMERPGDSFYNQRTWPFARLETTRELSIGGTAVPPGNYALVFHPNTPGDAGMSLEVRKLSVPEFLQPGNVMTPTPEGETVWRDSVHFDRTDVTEPALRIDLAPQKTGTKLTIRYGDRRLERDLAY